MSGCSQGRGSGGCLPVCDVAGSVSECARGPERRAAYRGVQRTCLSSSGPKLKHPRIWHREDDS